MVDYSKWKDIEVSDDEDETHPNVDTSSLFRWRHQARLVRMAESQREGDEILKGHEESKRKIHEIKQKLKEATSNPDINLEKVKLELNEVEKQEKLYVEKEKELAKKEKLTPWNVDTISHDGFAKTVINKKEARKQEDLTEDEKEERQREFVKKYKKQIKLFGMMGRWEQPTSEDDFETLPEKMIAERQGNESDVENVVDTPKNEELDDIAQPEQTRDPVRDRVNIPRVHRPPIKFKDYIVN